jgi:carboxymethylenebutenolidase
MTRIQFEAAKSKGEGEVFGNNEGKRPGIVLIQEWWGLNDHIRDVAQRYAKEGFLVLAIDLFHGKTTKDAGEANKLMGELDWEKAVAEIRGAVHTLRSHPSCTGKVGVTGFCMGGGLTFAAATSVEGISAAVPFYGLPPPKYQTWAKVKVPVLAHFAKKDGWVKPSIGEEIKKQVSTMEMYVYDEDHAFFNDTRPEVHGKESSKLAWERTIAFLKKNLA